MDRMQPSELPLLGAHSRLPNKMAARKDKRLLSAFPPPLPTDLRTVYRVHIGCLSFRWPPNAPASRLLPSTSASTSSSRESASQTEPSSSRSKVFTDVPCSFHDSQLSL